MLTRVNIGLLRTEIKFNQHNLVQILNTKFVEICSNTFGEKHANRWKGINISAFSGFQYSSDMNFSHPFFLK